MWKGCLCPMQKKLFYQKLCHFYKPSPSFVGIDMSIFFKKLLHYWKQMKKKILYCNCIPLSNVLSHWTEFLGVEKSCNLITFASSVARLGDISPIGLLLIGVGTKKQIFATFYFCYILGDIGTLSKYCFLQ